MDLSEPNMLLISMKWFHLATIAVIVVGLVVGGGAVQAVGADGTVQSEDGHSAPHETTVTATTNDHSPGEDHNESGQHSDGGDHGSTGPVHLAVEGLQIAFGFVAVASVVLAGRVYGGEIGRALVISGVGVTLFAIQRLWHNFHELGLLESPTALGQQSLFILAAGALAAGYFSLYQTMRKRTS